MEEVQITLTKAELDHLINDTIHYIWEIKEIVFGDNKWNFGTDITEVKRLNAMQRRKLRTYGYYSRKKLLDKLKQIEKENFEEITNNG